MTTSNNHVKLVTELITQKLKLLNAHEALLEAARYALEYLESNPDEYSEPRALKLKQAIAQAEGKSNVMR